MGGVVGSSEAAEVNSMTDRTLGAATVSSEGMQELPGPITGAGLATAVPARSGPEEEEVGGGGEEASVGVNGGL